MKKSSKILGSIALSAALVMGTAAPAFADIHADENKYSDPADALEGYSYTPDVNLTNNMTTFNSANDSEAEGASTVVKASTYTSQLNVTIPLVLPLMFDTVGGTGMAPKDDAYYIKNNSATPITVTKAVYKMNPTAKALPTDSTNTVYEWGFGTEQFNSPTSATSTKPVGDIYVKLTPTADTTALAADKQPAALELKNRSNAADGAEMTQDSLKWGIEAKDAVSGKSKVYGMKVEASSSILKKSVFDPVKLASITYTVAVGAENALGNDEGTSGLEDGKIPANTVKVTVSELKSFFGKAGVTNVVVKYADKSDTPADSQLVTLQGVEYNENGTAKTANAGDAIVSNAFFYTLTVADAQPDPAPETPEETPEP